MKDGGLLGGGRVCSGPANTFTVSEVTLETVLAAIEEFHAAERERWLRPLLGSVYDALLFEEKLVIASRLAAAVMERAGIRWTMP